MTEPIVVSGGHGRLDRYRSYLILLARAQLGPHGGCRLDASDVVQQTLLEAHGQQKQFRGQTEAQRGAWLRQILARNLADARRGSRRAKRDLRREQSMEASLNQSSMRLVDLLPADQSSPSVHLDRDERALQVADAVAELPDAQREALVMQYWQGMAVADIACRMGRTPAAVAGLLKRALSQLRQSLTNSRPD